jgi:hypothetical protein
MYVTKYGQYVKSQNLNIISLKFLWIAISYISNVNVVHINVEVDLCHYERWLRVACVWEHSAENNTWFYEL